jgi:hypothetical protein
LLYAAPDRQYACQFVADSGVGYGQYRLAQRGQPAVRALVSNRGLVVLVDGRRTISTVVGIVLVTSGVILRFAVPATFTYGLNTHVAGVIVMLAGISGLLLSLLVWGPLGRRRNHDGGSGRGAPPPGTGRRTASPDRTLPSGSDQSRSAFRSAEC